MKKSDALYTGESQSNALSTFSSAPLETRAKAALEILEPLIKDYISDYECSKYVAAHFCLAIAICYQICGRGGRGLISPGNANLFHHVLDLQNGFEVENDKVLYHERGAFATEELHMNKQRKINDFVNGIHKIVIAHLAAQVELNAGNLEICFKFKLR